MVGRQLHTVCTFVRIVRAMKQSVTFRLCLAFVALTAVVLAATLSLARWSFDRGFLDYVNAIEQVRLEGIRDVLIERYDRASNGWDQATLQRILSRERRFPPIGGHPSGGPPEGAPRGPEFPGPPGPPGHRTLGPPTALFDPDGQLLAGRLLDEPEAAQLTVPVLIDGQLVAELVSVPRRQLAAAPETAFSTRQMQASLLIGVVALLGAFLVSLVLARALVAPLRRALEGVNALASGDYDHRLNEPRSDEIGDLMRNLDRLGQTLAENQSSRNRWIADISHELRTPVAILAAELDAVRDGVRQVDDAQIDSFSEEVTRIRKLIDDLYELSLADLGGLRYEFCEADLAALIKDVTSTFMPRAAKLGIELRVDLPETARMEADTRRVEQLLLNLLENALAYTDQPGQIVVRLAHRSGDWCLCVEDSKPGVPEDECGLLFEPLYRREASRNRRAGGAGLGLAICRSISEAHGGEIVAMPSPLGGLKVEVTFWSNR